MFYLLVAVVIWSVAYGLVKNNLTHIDPYFASCLRLCVAAIFFLPWFRPQGLSKYIVARLLLIGGVQYGLMYCLYLKAMHYLNAYEVALFTLFIPLYIHLIGDFYAKRFHPIHWLMACVGIAGALVIKYQTPVWDHLQTGFLLMQGANLFFAWGMIDYRTLRQKAISLKDHQIYAVIFVGAAIAAALATTLSQGWSSWALLDSHTWGVIVYLSIIATGIGFFSWNKGTTLADPGTTAVISLLKVPLGVIASLVLFNEKTDILRLMIGLSIILGALFISESYARKKQVVA